ncbi:hypothetical protein [Pelagicoccus sp. SDUM812005]|uniref:hypothetical protein n=1 Tax=Pelagicoccus sp. SDUM812005 TaxID=3041257 RepID=UPI00280F5852|nr:hypothetical protein [Pelagicoccus sp. SDUM812005]MDQ8181618.1 hypothetical protein [Pelagicoccus sp. SDUM812005]
MKAKAVLTHSLVFALGAAASYWAVASGSTEETLAIRSEREDTNKVSQTGVYPNVAAFPRKAGFSSEELDRLLGRQGQSELLSYFSEWVRVDAQAAFDAMMALDDRDQRNEVAMALYESWGELDPAAALQSLDRMKRGDLWNLSSVMLTRGWSLSDPVAASRFVDELPPGGLRVQHVSALLGNWAAADPKEALQWAGALPSLSEQREALSVVFGKWGSLDPDEAFAELSRFDDGPWKSENYASILRSWATADAQGAAEYLLDETALQRVDSQVLAAVATQFLEDDPAVAVAWIGSLPDARAQAATVINVMSELTRLAPESTRELLSEMPAAVSEGAWLQYTNVWAGEDLEAAAQWAGSLTDPALKSEAVKGVALRLSGESPESAARWVASQEFAGSERLLVQLLSEWGAHEPYKAYRMAAEKVPSQYLEAATYQIASSLTREDPGLAAEWLEVLPNDDTRSTLTNGVFEEWVRLAPEEARVYAESLEDPVSRRAAFEACFEHARRYDASSAFAWLEREGMLGINDQQLRNAYYGWEAKAPDRAREWAERNAQWLKLGID